MTDGFKGSKLRPGGIITNRENIDHWNDRFPDDDVKPCLVESVRGSDFVTALNILQTMAENAQAQKKFRIVLDFDPETEKTVITYFSPKASQNREEA